MSIRTNSILPVYPMDSRATGETDENGFPVYDREYNATDLREFDSLLYTDGVFGNCLDVLTPTVSDGTWSVGAGAAMAHGLRILVTEPQKVIDQADIPAGSYAYFCAAARFDTDLRDGGVYARLSASSSEAPVRTESLHELIIARVDWRGNMTDYRLDNSMCGLVRAVVEVDTDALLAQLSTAMSQFDVRPGTVATLPSGSSATVDVRKPEAAGDPVLIDYGIPRGAKGEPGEDGAGLHIGPDEPDRRVGTVWMVEDRGASPHRVTAIKACETDGLTCGPEAVCGPDAIVGGASSWVDIVIDPSCIGAAA